MPVFALSPTSVPTAEEAVPQIEKKSPVAELLSNKSVGSAPSSPAATKRSTSLEEDFANSQIGGDSSPQQPMSLVPTISGGVERPQSSSGGKYATLPKK